VLAYSLEYELTNKRVYNLEEYSINCSMALLKAIASTEIEDVSEVGTTTTVVTMKNHGLTTNDYIYNETKNAIRKVTYIDANNISVDYVEGQTDGDVIVKYKNATKWTLGEVDPLYDGQFRDFESNNKTLLDFIRND